MRIAALVLLILAIAAKLLWHPAWDIGFPVSNTEHRGFSVSWVAFWILLSASVVLGVLGWMKRSH